MTARALALRQRLLHGTHRVNVNLPAGGIDDTQERVQVGAARDHLPAILAVHALHQGGRGADDVGLRQAQASDPAVKLFAQQQGLVLGAAAVLVAVGELDELAKRGIAIAAARLDLGGVKFGVIVTRGGVDAEMLRVEGLDDNLPGLFAAPGAPRYLCQQGEGAFRGGKIGQHQRNIGGDDAYQRHAGQVKPFGDHLRTDQDVSLAVGEAVQQLLVGAAIFGRVAVPAQQARAGKGALDSINHFLGSQAKIAHTLAAALRAEAQHLALTIAVMAEQNALGSVIGKRHVALVAHRHETTRATENAARRAAPVEIKNGLLAPAQDLFDLTVQAAADNAGIARVQFIAQVDDLDGRQRRTNAVGQLNQAIDLPLGAIKRLDGEIGRAHV